MKKENGAVDIAKLIMAVLVIIIHKPIFEESHPFLNYLSGNIICSVAVPFFFIASSYFFFIRIDKEKNNGDLLLRFEQRLFKLYLLWTIIYLPCIFVKYNTNSYNELNIKLLIGQLFLTIKNFFLSTSFVHLWYVNTLMLSVAIIYFIYKKTDLKATFVVCVFIAVIFNIINISSTDGSKAICVYNALPDILHNTFEKGILFTSGGFLLSKIKRQNENDVLKYILAVLFFAVLIINGVCRYKIENKIFDYLNIGLVFIVSLLLFDICLNIKTRPSKKYYIIRKYSTVIYFSHLLLMSDGFRYIASKTGITAFADNELLIFSTTLVFAIIISTIIIHLSQKPKLKILKNLY